LTVLHSILINNRGMVFDQMNKEGIIESTIKCLDWIEKQMLTYNYGSWGIYERIRIDKNLRVNWVRPDCNAEVARVLSELRTVTKEDRYNKLFNNITEWLFKAQDNNELSAWYGSFPFYYTDGNTMLPADNPAIFQNDNGKVLMSLIELYRATNNETFLNRAIKLANYWIQIQRPEGYFYWNDGGKTQAAYKGPCFVLWLAAGLIMCYTATGNVKYKKSAYLAYDYVLRLQLDNGRILTSYEIEKIEDWRPASSEAAIALYTFSKAYNEVHDSKFLDPIKKSGKYLLSLQDKCGGILNCDDGSMMASLQNDKNLCDLVYTQGFALMGLSEAAKATGESIFTSGACNLARFLIKIQCNGESDLWDGAWRGSFNITTWKWDGRADQNNPIDEGGMYSVYTGWCAATIMYGLLLVYQLIEQ